MREEENLAEFQVLADGMYGNSVRNALLNAIYLPIVITLGSVGTGLALWQGGVRLGDVSLGTLVAFMQYAAFFYIPIQELAARFTQVQVAQASAERLQGLLDTRPEILDSAEVADELANGRDSGGDPIDRVPGRLLRVQGGQGGAHRLQPAGRAGRDDRAGRRHRAAARPRS